VLPKQAVVGAGKALRASPLGVLLLASAVLKLAYVFFFTEYPTYLFSDFGGYWDRAHQRMAGSELDYRQWAFWPPLPHILLGWYLRVVGLFGLSARELEATLVANVAASTACVALLYGIALQVLKRPAWALAAAAAYAFTFPLAYFNAFVMSEHGAVLFMLAAVWVVLKFRGDLRALAAAGALLGLATAMRPAFGLFGLPCVLYLALADRAGLRVAIARGLAFSLAFFLLLGAVVGETYRISQGAVLGLSANAGQNFYFSQCRVSSVSSTYRGELYSFTAASFTGRPEYGSIHLDLPVHAQRFFADLGWRCLKEEPRPWGVLVQRASDLFFGPLLPTVPNAAGFATLLPLFRWLFLGCAVIAPLAFAGRRAHGVEPAALGLLGGVLAMALVTLALFGVEHRYLYPLLPLVYVLAACVVLLAIRDARRMATLGFAWLAVLGAAFFGTAAVDAAKWRGSEPVAIEIHRFGSPYVAAGIEPQLSRLTARRLYYPKGDRLSPGLGEDQTFAVHRTCMDVQEKGLYELQVVAPVGFALVLDRTTLLNERSPGMYAWRIDLPAGQHTYALRMDRAVGATATWRRVASRFSDFAPALDMRYIGEPGEGAAFLPPERCELLKH